MSKRYSITNRKVFLRIIILIVLFCVGYFLVVSTLRASSGLSLGELLGKTGTLLFGTGLVAFSITFLSIDFSKADKGVLVLGSLCLLLLVIAAIYFTTDFSVSLFLQLCSIIVFHVGILILSKTRAHYLTTRSDASTRGISQVGIVSFGLAVSVVVTLFLGVRVINTPLACNELYGALQEASYSNIEQVQQTSQNIIERSSQPVEDVVSTLGTSGGSSGFLGRIKTDVIDQIMEDKELVRESFCEVIAGILENRVTNNIWSFSVFIILFLLLSPIMTLLFRVITLINRLLLKILILLGIYKRKKKMQWIKVLK